MKLALSQISVRLPGMDRALFKIRGHEFASGSKVLIQGPSGKGKTTLLHLMAGLLLPIEGTIEIDGRDFSRLSEVERSRFRRDHMGIIFQKLNLISHLTAAENVRLGAGPRARPKARPKVRLKARPEPKSETITEAALAALEKVKLRDVADVLAQNLSLGQQQRVAVARILTQRPQLVLADEPTSSLDDDNAEAVMKALLNQNKGATLIVVSHDHRIRDRFEHVIDFAKLVDQ